MVLSVRQAVSVRYMSLPVRPSVIPTVKNSIHVNLMKCADYSQPTVCGHPALLYCIVAVSGLGFLMT